MPRKPNIVQTLPFQDFAINRKLPVADQFYRLLRQRIVELALEPGAPINDAAIAVSAGVSRTPVREALKRLEEEWLVAVYPSQGTYITKINVRRVREAIFLREMIEPEVAARCASLESRDALVRQLDELAERHRYAIEQSRGARVYGLDEAFHKALFEACDLTMIWTAVEIARGQMDRIHYLGKLSDLIPRRALQQHLMVIEAIRLGDADTARRRMLEHISTNHSVLQQTLKIKEEFFDDFK